MNYKKISISDLYAFGHLRAVGYSQYRIGGKRIDTVYTYDGPMYKYEHGSERYSTLRKAINAYDEN